MSFHNDENSPQSSPIPKKKYKRYTSDSTVPVNIYKQFLLLIASNKP